MRDRHRGAAKRAQLANVAPQDRLNPHKAASSNLTAGTALCSNRLGTKMNLSIRSALSYSMISAVLLSSLGLGGCGTYRVVRRTPNGGEVALQGTPGKAHEAADQYMASQCPSGYDIVEEGEAVIGSETQAQTTRDKNVWGRPVQRTTESTTDKSEWRIKYQCKAASANGVASRPQGEIKELVVRF